VAVLLLLLMGRTPPDPTNDVTVGLLGRNFVVVALWAWFVAK
jgi:hypothetical protein